MQTRTMEDLARANLSDLTATPFHNRPEEWALYRPLVGRSMLELGGKINRPYTYKDFFEHLGYRHVSVDWNGEHGALALDLREPLNLGTFDMVTNIGTSEHVDEQRGVWQNMVDACHVGSILISTTPLPGGDDWCWHGTAYPTYDFYEQLQWLNGFVIQRLYTEFQPPRRMIFCRMVRVETGDAFKMPDEGLIYQNVIRPRPVNA